MYPRKYGAAKQLYNIIITQKGKILMKKRIMIMLTMAIVFAMIAIPSVAATITAGAGSDSHEVKATYKPNSGSGGSGGIVYSVDITWDAMEFTYTEGEAGAWLPEEHQYAPNEKAIWSSTSNTVKITNHSNTAITATLSYTAAAGYTSITGAFYETSGNANDGVLALSTAVGTTFANAPTASASLMLSGKLDSTTAAKTTVGTVTVTLS